MKEQWTKDLQKKMNGFEVPTIPEGLWENIDSALETGDKRRVIGISGKPKEQAANTQHLTPNTRYWRKACAAILLLLAIPTALYLLHDKEDEEIVAEVEKNAPFQEVSTQKAIAQNDTETSPTLSSVKRVKKQGSKVSILKDNSEDITTSKAEETEQNSEATVKENAEKSQDSTPAFQAHDKKEETNQEYSSPFEADFDGLPKKEPSNRPYLAMNTSGTTLFSKNIASVKEDPRAAYNGNDVIWKGDSNSNNMDSGDPDYEERHHRPISIGLQVGIPVAEDWSVVTGLTYTYMHSEIEDNANTVNFYTDQKLHFIGIPVQMNYKLYNNRHCNIYLGTGGQIDFGVSGKTNNEDHLRHLPVNYSLKAAAGVQVNLFKSLNIYAEPTVQYNIPGSTRYKTYYTKHKTMFDLQLGIRFTP